MFELFDALPFQLSFHFSVGWIRWRHQCCTRSSASCGTPWTDSENWLKCSKWIYLKLHCMHQHTENDRLFYSSWTRVMIDESGTFNAWDDSLILTREDQVPRNCMHTRCMFDDSYLKESMYHVQLLVLVICDVSDVSWNFLASLSCESPPKLLTKQDIGEI